MKTTDTNPQSVLAQSNAFLHGAISLANDYDNNYPRMDRERTFFLVNEFIAAAKRGYVNYAVIMQQKEISR